MGRIQKKTLGQKIALKSITAIQFLFMSIFVLFCIQVVFAFFIEPDVYYEKEEYAKRAIEVSQEKFNVLNMAEKVYYYNYIKKYIKK